MVGFGNLELQCYTKRRENVRVEDGKLIIEARKEDYGNFHTRKNLISNF